MELAIKSRRNALAPEPAPLPIIEARSIAKSYGATEALKQVDLSILPGEIHALLGGNGAGKSTLVKILLGVIQPSAGKLYVRQQPMVMRSVREAMAAGIYPIYQDLSQFPHLTVRENFAAFSLGTTSAFFARSAMPTGSSIRRSLDSCRPELRSRRFGFITFHWPETTFGDCPRHCAKRRSSGF